MIYEFIEEDYDTDMPPAQFAHKKRYLWHGARLNNTCPVITAQLSSSVLDKYFSEDEYYDDDYGGYSMRVFKVYESVSA